MKSFNGGLLDFELGSVEQNVGVYLQPLKLGKVTKKFVARM